MPDAPLTRAHSALMLAFVTAFAATLGALFICEVLGRMPCTMCWYQRIAMFPMVIILGVATFRDDLMTVRLPAGLLAHCRGNRHGYREGQG